MKRIFAAILLACAAIACAPAGVSGQGAQTVNDIDLAQWSLEESVSGQTVEVSEQGGAAVGLLLRPGEGGNLSATYLKPFPCADFMIDFSAAPPGGEAERELMLEMLGESGNNLLYGVKLLLRADSYDAVLQIAGQSYALEGVSYGESGRIQVKLAKEEVENFETAEKSLIWNFVAGADKNTNQCVNRFRKSAFAAFDELLEQAGNASAYLSIAGYGCEGGVTIRQILFDCFYDYVVFETQPPPSGEIGYSSLKLVWDLPDNAAYPRTAFIVERSNASGTERKSFYFNNAYAASISDSGLKQGTRYTYTVLAVSQLDTITNRVACSNVSFKYAPISVTTKKGSPTAFLIALAAILLAVCGAVILYVFYYDIKRKRKGASGK